MNRFDRVKGSLVSDMKEFFGWVKDTKRKRGGGGKRQANRGAKASLFGK
jgi:hypothetical protein